MPSLKQRLARRDAMLVAGCANALMVRLVEDLGYEAAYVTGAGVTNMYLGLPDLSFITLDQLAAHVAAMRNVSELPLIVDADTGFGNAVNVGHTVRVLERAGASCIQIEDQVFPKRCGHFEGKEVVSREEFAAKIRAAVDARRSDETLILARTDARACKGFEDALERARLALEAGADCLFVEAPESLEEIRAVPAALDAPCLLNLVFGGKTPLVSQRELAEMGYAMVLYANAALQAAITGMRELMTELLQVGSLDRLAGRLASFDERQSLVRKQDFDALERRYAIDSGT